MKSRTKVLFILALSIICTATFSNAAKAALVNNNQYLKPSLENFSRLYWALGIMDPKIDEQIDNYMAINECDIYKDYKFNEFEWKNIRETARKMLTKSAPTFGTRFSIMQEIKLGGYDETRGGFEVQDKFSVDNSRRFEINAVDTANKVCGLSRYINYYPKGIILELSRPFTLDFLPVHESLARSYIEESIEEFRNIKEKYQTQENLYNKRSAYMEMNVKVFSFLGYGRSQSSAYLAKTIGVLESIKVYADRKKTTLLFAKTFGKRKKNDTIDPKLREQFESFLEKRKNIKIVTDYDPSREN